jgi:hypothetical protein
MQLALTVFFAVLGATVLLALAGMALNRSAARDERIEGRE